MYCRKCGKLLEDGDAFCVHCGEPVRKTTEEPARKSAAAHNPEFTWNVERAAEPRKTEDIHFNWRSGSNEPTMPVEPPYRAETTQPVETERKTAAYEDAEGAVRGRALEQELFREMEEADREARGRHEERFYTFTQKNEEFQRLLDREYEKILKNGTPVERPLHQVTVEIPVEEKPLPTAPAEPVTPAAPIASAETEDAEPEREPLKADEIRTIWEEIKADLERENQKQVGVSSDTASISREAVARAEARAAMEAAKPQPKAEEPAQPSAEQSTAEEAKAAATATALTRIWEELDEEEEEPKKKHRIGLVLFLIVLLLLLLVLADLVIQKFAPDTRAAEWAQTAEEWVTDKWQVISDWVSGLLEKTN